MNAKAATSTKREPIGDDKRLDRLFEYTKFHIGIYLSAGAGLLALLTTEGKGLFSSPANIHKPVLCFALACMLVADRGRDVAARRICRRHRSAA
jgi:hypothetical protein